MDLYEDVSRIAGITVSLHVWPPDASRCAELFPHARISAQVGADLGARLDHATTRALDELGGPVLVVGGDHPNLPAGWVTACFAAARTGAVGWIPTDDGGFAAMALDRARPELFADVPWSTPGVANAVRRNAARSGARLVAPGTWYDVDDRDDLARLVRDLERGASCPHTRRVLATLGGTSVSTSGFTPQGPQEESS